MIRLHLLVLVMHFHPNPLTTHHLHFLELLFLLPKLNFLNWFNVARSSFLITLPNSLLNHKFHQSFQPTIEYCIYSTSNNIGLNTNRKFSAPIRQSYLQKFYILQMFISCCKTEIDQMEIHLLAILS